jgi:hypothetical protein
MANFTATHNIQNLTNNNIDINDYFYNNLDAFD